MPVSGWSGARETAQVERAADRLTGRIVRDPSGFAAALELALGPKADRAATNALIDAARADRLPLPAVRFVDSGGLGAGAAGAYAGGGRGTILLDRALLADDARFEAVFTEEMGHHFDALLGGADARGDEGELFARALLGPRAPSGEALGRLRAEDDRGTVLLDGVARSVEFSAGPPGEDAALRGVRCAAEALTTAPRPQAAVEADRTALADEIRARASNASNRTDFRNLAARYESFASLNQSRHLGDAPGGLGADTLRHARRWVEASSMRELGYDLPTTVRDDGVRVSMVSWDPHVNESAAGRAFARDWLAAGRDERLARLGVDPARSDRTMETLEVADECRDIAHDLDRGIGGFFRNPVRYLADEVIGPVTDLVLQPIVDADIPIVSALAADAQNARDTAVDLVDTVVHAPGAIATGIAHDGIDGGIKEAVHQGGRALEVAGEGLVTHGSLAANAAVDAVERATDQVERRGLSAAERTEMRRVFGDAIDYDEVVLQTGGARGASGMASNVNANTVYLKETDGHRTIWGADGRTLNANGYELLAHEMVHVWQYQRGGPGYMGAALNDQWQFGRDDAYDWRKAVADGTSFLEMGPEQQGDLVKAIYRTVRSNLPLDIRNFNQEAPERLPQFVALNEREFAIVREAARVLGSGFVHPVDLDVAMDA